MSLVLAIDALESVKLMPTSSLLWQRLSALIDTLLDYERTTLIQAVTALPCESRDARWLRCSALACLTHDPEWFCSQAALVDDMTATDAVMSLLGMIWYHALVRASNHQACIQLLREIDAPYLQRLVAGRLSEQKALRRDDRSGGLRVAVYTPEVAHNRHGGTLLTLNTMSALASRGVDLYGFSAKEASIPAIGSYHGGNEFLTPFPVDPASLKLYSSGNVQLSFPNVGFSLRTRLDQVLQAIDAYAPDVVVFVGFMSPLVYRLYTHYPVVGLSVHALPPVAPVDVWLSADPHGNAACWPGVPAPQVFSFPFRFWPTSPATPVDRAVIGLPSDATLLVTAGYRLDTEIMSPWREQMLGFVEARPEVHWLLVGVPEKQSPESLPVHPRIHWVPPQSSLAPWLAMCDIYINPPRMGGGGALAMAMEQGLPVATFAGSDGGDKVGGYAVESGEAYFALLRAWVYDRIARQQAGDALKARFHERLNFSSEAAATGLIQACDLAMKTFQQRREALSA